MKILIAISAFLFVIIIAIILCIEFEEKFHIMKRRHDKWIKDYDIK